MLVLRNCNRQLGFSLAVSFLPAKLALTTVLAVGVLFHHTSGDGNELRLRGWEEFSPRQLKCQRSGQGGDLPPAVLCAKFFVLPFLLPWRFHREAGALALKCWLFDFVPIAVTREALKSSGLFLFAYS